MLRAIWCRLARVWGLQRADKPRPKARRMAKGLIPLDLIRLGAKIG